MSDAPAVGDGQSEIANVLRASGAEFITYLMLRKAVLLRSAYELSSSHDRV
jgi:hypothetical protein